MRKRKIYLYDQLSAVLILVGLTIAIIAILILIMNQDIGTNLVSQSTVDSLRATIGAIQFKMQLTAMP